MTKLNLMMTEQKLSRRMVEISVLQYDIFSLFQVVCTLLPRGHGPNKVRERNAAVNASIGETLKGNSRAQLVNIDAPSTRGFIQVQGDL